MEPTGKEFAYLHVCQRKLWLFRHGIRPELEYGNVQIGMLLGEKSFSREKKEIPLGECGVLDWADFPDGVIHETKKGKSPGRGDAAQVAYYLWLLDRHGVRVREARIHYPAQRKTDTVFWSPELAESVEKDAQMIAEVVSLEVPPAAERKNICARCAYEEVCFA
ncbi:MAG: CRISPR-associated protein Cas4 [Victivallaceae bacterium]|nr:CRISPR-associated protein Cas4 [Victivallaceae bacterium]